MRRFVHNGSVLLQTAPQSVDALSAHVKGTLKEWTQLRI